jgi:hypothetical protein
MPVHWYIKSKYFRYAGKDKYKVLNVKKECPKKTQPKFNIRKYLYQTYGVDVTMIYGFKQTSALTVLSETGPNIKEKFPTLKQFL